jgi:hypothetical protein
MPTFKKRLAKVLMTQVPAPPDPSLETRSLGADEGTSGGAGPGGGATQNAPIFANYKAVTFPGLVGFVTAIWLGLQQTETAWTFSRWVPLALCLLFGGSLTWLELSEDDVTPPSWKFWGALVGLGNCFVLFSAVMGASGMVGGPPPDRPVPSPRAVAGLGSHQQVQLP